MNSFLKEKLEKFRDRLLDTTNRNRMINSNFNQRNKQYFRFIDELPNQLYVQLQEKTMSFKEIPIETREIKDEDTEEFKNEYERQLLINEDYLNVIEDIENSDEEGVDQKTEDARRKLKNYVRSILKLPESIFEQLDIKEAAKKNNIDPSWELPKQTSQSQNESKHQDKFIQTLMFKEELNTYLKNIRRVYKSSLSESGVNPLYICFGFLEWRESTDSDKLLKSPLLMAQIDIDEKKDKNNFDIKMSDEPIIANQTLNEKLKSNFSIELPEVVIDEKGEFDIEKYLTKVQKIVASRNWKVARIGTFGIYNAHTMPIFNDINNILKNKDVSKLLEKVLVGSDKEASHDSASVYDIDKKELEDDSIPPLVCDADASQHSAVIDSLSGKSFVIKGPPGTGKSQTITNIISALMRKGNKVLFVAQKQAALDVVRNRLEAVGLESYIMESFSAKLNKKSIFESLNRRINLPKPSMYGADIKGKTNKYRETKQQLNIYSHIMNSTFAQTEMKVHDLVWDVKNIDDELNTKGLDELIRFDTKKITQTQLEEDIENIKYLRESYKAILDAQPDVKSKLLLITKVPDNPFDREELANSIQSLKEDMQTYDNLKTQVLSEFQDDSILDCVESNEMIKDIVSNSSNISSKEWKLLNIFINEDSKELTDKARNIFKQINKLQADLDLFIQQADSHPKFFSNSVTNTTVIEIQNIIDTFKRSNVFSSIAYLTGLSFLVKDYKAAKDHFKRLFKNTSMFEKEDALLEELKRARIKYDTQNHDIREQEDMLTQKKEEISDDEDTRSYLKDVFVDKEYDRYISSVKGLNDDVKSNLYNNNDNLQLLTKYHSFKKSFEENIVKASNSLGLPTDSTFDEKINILKTLNESEVSIDEINDYLNEISEPKNNRFIDFFKAYVTTSSVYDESIKAFVVPKFKLSDIEKYYKNIIRKIQYRALYKEYPALNKFNISRLIRLREDLYTYDKELTDSAKKMYKNQIHSEGDNAPAGQASGRVKEKSEFGLLNHVTSKTKTRISLRHMFKKAFTAVTAYKPCTMMSPLTVSQLLPLNNESYDTVIIDEASQMKPEYAIGAIARTKQLIVVGDQKQLPPARDFEARFSDVDDEDDIFDESILDMAITVFYPARELLFHYRSRHQDLIKFSNAKFYQNLLIPMTASLNSDDRGLKRIYLPDACYVTGNTGTGGTNFMEAERVIEEAVNIMKTRPEESLGIATMNKKQAEYLEDLMERKRSQDPDVQKYIQKWSEVDSKVNQFFIKNLANVQGDERDIIIVSTLFGPDRESGKVRQTFGPINQAGGQRRLNVLFTRAKNQLILVTSMTSSDITVDENSTQEGRRIFKEYLAYAESEDREIQIGEVTGREVESPFQQWAIDVIDSVPGFKADWEIGVKGFRIDIGVKHENYPYSYLLAVETDGASYHSIKSARDRDKLRQEILESHGWVFHRIWSTDWIQNPVKTKEKLIAAIKDRLNLLLSKLPKEDRVQKDEQRAHAPVTIQAKKKHKSPRPNQQASDLMTRKLDMITGEDKWKRVESENDIYATYSHIYNSEVITFLLERYRRQKA
jgi:DNA polymerase III delta prime subunit